MAGPITLRPIVTVPAAADASVRRGKFGLLGIAGWLCLVGMGSSQPISHAASPAPASSASCRLHQRTPFYVGLPEGAPLDSFEESAIATRHIVREVKQWACGASTRLSVAVPSLQLAFARNAPIQLDRLQLDDVDLLHAHVVLSSSVGASDRLHWRVELTHGPEDTWIVMGTGAASPADLAEP